MKKVRIVQVDSFTKEKFRGNPAGIVPDADGLTDDQMQAIARELNNSETAFILSPTGQNHEVWIRFFTPTTEVPSCGHATIAAHYVRAVDANLPSCRVIQKIGIGILPVEVVREDHDYKIIMTQGRPEFSEIFLPDIGGKIIKALGLSESDIDRRCPIQIVSTGHSKVMIGIRSRNTLNNLTPNLDTLRILSSEIDCNGYFVFTFDSDDDDILTYGRMFAPAIGIAEDPVTGNANGPLGAYLVKHKLVDAADSTFSFKGRQGEAMGRLGTVDVAVDHKSGEPTRVRVGGRAVIVFKTEIEI